MAFFDYWPDLFDALKATVLAAWPELADDTHGVWESTESARVSIARKTWPIGVIQLLSAAEGEWGMHNTVYEQAVAIWYVRATPSGSTETLRSKLKALQDALLANGRVIEANGTEFLTLGFSRVDTSHNNEANLPWFVRNTGMQSGAVVPVLLCGDFEG